MSQEVVLVAQGLFESDVREPRDVDARRVTGEACSVDLGVVEVVVGGSVEVAGRECRLNTGVVFEAVRAAVQSQNSTCAPRLSAATTVLRATLSNAPAPSKIPGCATKMRSAAADSAGPSAERHRR